jgi:hypothetical protein
MESPGIIRRSSRSFFRSSKKFFTELVNHHGGEPVCCDLINAVRNNDILEVQRVLMDKEIDVNAVDPNDEVNKRLRLGPF